MVDTVKLLIKVTDPLILRRGTFYPHSVEQLVNTYGVGRIFLNPSPSYAKVGKYMPRLTLHKRPNRTYGVNYQLAVEFSAPKMLFNNNFDELNDSDFEQLLAALQQCLHELTGYRFPKFALAQAEIGSWHPSKNIVFLDYTSCQTIISTIAKLEVSQIYDLQKDRYRDGGQSLHIHCNSLDICFYDKMIDMRRAKTSEKRTIEKDNQIQMKLFETLYADQVIEVLRYEVRLVGKKSVERAFPDLEKRTFETLYNKQLSKQVLLKHWTKLSSSIDMLALDVNKPYELLQNYIIENPGATPQNSLAAVTGLLIDAQQGARSLRSLIEARYKRDAWYRIKKLLKAPKQYRFTHFQRVDDVLNNFDSVCISDYEKLIVNNSNI
jgi:hypothetical protein